MRLKKTRMTFVVLALYGALTLPTRAAQPANQALTLSLMPVPASVQVTPGRLPLDSNFRVSVQQFTDGRLEHAVDRALWRVETRTAITLSHVRAKSSEATLVVYAGGPGMKVQGLEEDESYTLETNSQQAVLRAPTVVGVLRGLETFLQLLQADRDGFFFPLVRIEDRPRFVWRGLLVDVARSWQSVEGIKRILDAMAVVKLNVFHWHLSDTQGCRVESLRYPRLQQMGSDGLYYTQTEIREIVAYARDLGIRIVPEFDMPGHANCWFLGYPELGAGPGPYTMIHGYDDNGPPSVDFDPTRAGTYRFIDNFIGEMVRLFPDTYWHIGGDEVEGVSWDKNPAIQTFMRRQGLKNNAALQAYFNQRLVQILQKHGRRMVGWDEILRSDLRKDVVIQSWRGERSLAAGAKQGYDGILSAPYYLDKMRKTSFYYAADPLPARNDLNPTEAAHILGGEACAWGELVSEENIESRIWPYTAAIAERFWSPREITDTQDMYRRLAVVTLRLEEAGARHLANSAVMLRRAVDEVEIPVVVTDFLGLVEPPSLGKTQDERPSSQLTPLTALGYFATADPSGARHFAALVDGLLADAPRYEAFHDELTRELKIWRELRPSLALLAERSPLLHDADGTAADLADLSTAGEEAIDFLRKGVSPPVDWTQRQMLLLNRADKSKGLMRVAVLDAMRKLITAAGSANTVPH